MQRPLWRVKNKNWNFFVFFLFRIEILSFVVKPTIMDKLFGDLHCHHKTWRVSYYSIQYNAKQGRLIVHFIGHISNLENYKRGIWDRSNQQWTESLNKLHSNEYSIKEFDWIFVYFLLCLLPSLMSEWQQKTMKIIIISSNFMTN